MNERVSVVMPVFDAARYLPAALASVAALDWPDLEFVAVDDGSTDASAQILADAADAWARAGRRMRVLRQPNRGAGAARDTGIAAASGALILLADSDDLCDPDLVRMLVDALGDGDVAFARCRYIDADGSEVAVQERQPERPDVFDLLCGFMVNTPLVRRSAIETVGGHDHDLPGSIDLDLFVRIVLARPGAMRAVPDVLSSYRRHGAQITGDWRRMERTWRRIVDKARASGYALPPRRLSVARGRHCVFWSTLAYQGGDYAAARRLMAEAMRRVPRHVLSDDLARVRALACLASLLPDRVHGRLRDAVNARRTAT